MMRALTLTLCFCALALLGLKAQVGYIPSDSSTVAVRLFIPTAQGDEQVPFGEPSFWTPILDQSLTAEVAWAYTAAGDSLACDPVVTDLTGKIALIRRGDCTFLQKVENAEAQGAIAFLICNNNAAAPDEVITLGAADGTSVGIPGAMISYNNCQRVAEVIDGGSTGEATFSVAEIYNGTIVMHPVMPVSQIQERDGVLTPRANYRNGHPSDSIFIGTLTVTYPGGSTEVIGTTLDTIQPGDLELMVFPDADLDFSAGVGTYTYTFSSDIPNSGSYSTTVVVTEDYFQTVKTEGAGGVGLSDAGYAAANSQQSVGLLVYITEQVTAESFSFGLCNGAELLDANNLGPFIEVVVIDTDFNNDGEIDIPDFNPVNNTPGDFDADNTVAFAEYEVNGTEACDGYDSLVTLSLTPTDNSLDSVVLDTGKYYMVLLTINSQTGGSAVAPTFLAGPEEVESYSFGIQSEFGEVATLYNTILVTDRTYVGFNGLTLFSRFTVGDYQPSGLFNPEIAGKMTVSPSPANQVATVDIDVATTLHDARLSLLDSYGRAVQSAPIQLSDGKARSSFDVRSLPNGMYTILLQTSAGQKSARLMVLH